MIPKFAILTFGALFLFPGIILATPSTGADTASGGISPADHGPFSLAEDDFAGRQLVWSYFQALAKRDDVMVIDVRSGFILAGDPPGLKNLSSIPLESFLNNFAARQIHQDKTLLIFDEAGLELRRLQYHLQKYGYDDYFFLRGGATGALNPGRAGS